VTPIGVDEVLLAGWESSVADDTVALTGYDATVPGFAVPSVHERVDALAPGGMDGSERNAGAGASGGVGVKVHVTS
jgi:hypothetical protein